MRGSLKALLGAGGLAALALSATIRDAPAQGPSSPPRRATMEELHRHGGVPRGWKFTVPPGDAAKGRQLFQDLECYKCHAIKGESFPPSGGDPKTVGPDLTGMGARHPAEYLAESILAPNHVIVEGPGYTGPDGLSIMPSFADSLSLTQWLDLVAYLKSLTAGGGDHHGAHEVVRERMLGDYKIRLVYAADTGQDGGGHHGAHHGGGQGTAPAAGGHLMAFVMDRETDEPVPYLPVTATIHAAGAAPRTLRLAPVVGDRGFHYGARLALPERTQKITLAVGATTMQVVESARERFKKPVTAIFEWTGR